MFSSLNCSCCHFGETGLAHAAIVYIQRQNLRILLVQKNHMTLRQNCLNFTITVFENRPKSFQFSKYLNTVTLSIFTSKWPKLHLYCDILSDFQTLWKPVLDIVLFWNIITYVVKDVIMWWVMKISSLLKKI